ncbi:hypothetical protein [Acinetobacter venetianus]|uniref:hypothetical protein n=1 Tax=Acinetobacter venetianus TaxID=52133 RepID=UPI00384BB739
MLVKSKVITHSEHSQANARLQAIGAGLSVELLKSIATAAVTHASQVTKNNAANAYGVYLYQNFIKSLRDQLKIHGWNKSSVHNREATISPDLSTSIVVMSATQGVCINQPPNLPTNKNPKGPKFIEDMVKQFKDSIVLPLFEELPNLSYWTLLHYRDEEKLYLELSRPNAMTSDCKYIASYHERIFIGEIYLTGKTADLDKLLEAKREIKSQPEISVSRKRG